MLKFVDDTEQNELNGYAYHNQDGQIEIIDTDYNLVLTRKHSGEDLSVFYVEDIPKIIKALQAAYDEYNKEGV